ncbi:type II toxin-antitoxin system VapC family toxin [Phenylobacterium aquaticum]|uniref:type II toxin-antitoxin system VapC family toxin n=1 Tax=Phenylobacterium aquaticum TaxID=1763816 RepID=UPI0026EA53A8|nr:type II toxin-antitoxin system VapC family toxin [Phenylobacterium aquaticum]
MICVDCSALMAVLLGEPAAQRCEVVLAEESELVISAATLAEALIVSSHRGLEAEMTRLVEAARLRVIDVTTAAASRAAEAYRKWGRGRHAARLNYGDCFAYELASHMACPLLYVGDDFSKTDLESAL